MLIIPASLSVDDNPPDLHIDVKKKWRSEETQGIHDIEVFGHFSLSLIRTSFSGGRRSLPNRSPYFKPMEVLQKSS